MFQSASVYAALVRKGLRARQCAMLAWLSVAPRYPSLLLHMVAPSFLISRNRIKKNATPSLAGLVRLKSTGFISRRTWLSSQFNISAAGVETCG